ncbi:hypothetical protein NEMBOFW57_008678 [Staphylotrichum longicolle]|uniref:Uncharacterized protein n=1 Tax=Staphylotrichum longicolle TaxID=669026 RepID=A0AAD4HU76_9PEZI|nr:hypothetical protein NEMBOFW57_008678 [Staphylotrichum longicolle]
MGDSFDSRFAPYSEEDSINPGESVADIIARDQIRRSELILERPLTEAQKNIIRNFYRDRGQIRAPNEQSQPHSLRVASLSSNTTDEEIWHKRKSDSDGSNTISGLTRELWPPPVAREPLVPDVAWEPSSPPAARGPSTPPIPGPSVVGATSEAVTRDLQEQVTNLRDQVKALEARLIEAERQPTYDQRILDSAHADILRLNQEKRGFQERVAALGKALNDLKEELESLKFQVEHDADKLKAQAGEFANRRPQPPLMQAGIFSLTLVTFAMAVMVWLVTEAMLHSKRLSDGFGPFINGGYNGLGSVVIFGTWGKFLLFNAVMVYLCMFSVQAALGV